MGSNRSWQVFAPQHIETSENSNKKTRAPFVSLWASLFLVCCAAYAAHDSKCCHFVGFVKNASSVPTKLLLCVLHMILMFSCMFSVVLLLFCYCLLLSVTVCYCFVSNMCRKCANMCRTFVKHARHVSENVPSMSLWASLFLVCARRKASTSTNPKRLSRDYSSRNP